MPEEPTEYPPLPGAIGSPEFRAANAGRPARRAAQPPQDEQPPEDVEPDFVEPPEDVEPVPPPPRNAPLHLQMVLSTVRDPVERQLLLDTYAEMGPGLNQELFGNVAAYFSAILDHQLGRPDESAGELFAVADQLRNVSEEWGTALIQFEAVVKLMEARAAAGGQPAAESEDENAAEGKAGTRFNAQTARANMAQAAALRPIMAAEVDRAVAAAHAVNARNLKLACGACFLAGIVVAALFVHFL